MEGNDYSHFLKSNIELLEKRRIDELVQLKAQLSIYIDSVHPANILKDTVHELAADFEFKGDLIKTTIGIASDYISSKIKVNETARPMLQLFGTLVRVGLTNLMSRKPANVKEVVEPSVSENSNV